MKILIEMSWEERSKKDLEMLLDREYKYVV